ncbi:MAG: ABC transporter permease [Phycisphaerales bacterium]|nr:ABC transporter permease [Phycisphaerales bacterium]
MRQHSQGEDASPAIPLQEIVIKPQKGWIGINWGEMFRQHELLFFLVGRDIKVRYKQTIFGVLWAVIQPLLTMLIFTVIFNKVAGINSDSEIPYPVFVYAGLLPWQFFSAALTSGSTSLIGQQNLLTKVYLPRMFLPAASLGSAFVDFCIAFIILIILMLIYDVHPSWSTFAIPLLVLLVILTSLGITLIFSALCVSYRDVRYVVPFAVQILMYLSPVIYPVSIVPKQYQWILALNPMTGIIDGFRSSLLGAPWNFMAIGVSTLIAILLLLFGLFFFRRTERRFADIA